MRRFVVVSYDSEEQQWFYDFVLATSPEIAKARVCAVRPYVIDADALRLDEVTRMARSLRKASRREMTP